LCSTSWTSWRRRSAKLSETKPHGVGAISEAAGVVQLLRDRLREDDAKGLQFMMVFDKQLEARRAAKWWADLPA
jgi:hypothetical protein